VFGCVASHAWTNDPAWEPEVLEVHPLDDGPLRLGGRVLMTRKDFGKVQSTTYEITALEAPRRLAVRHLDGAMDFALEFLVTPAGPATTDLTATVNAQLRGAMRLLTPVFALVEPRRTARITRDAGVAIEAATRTNPSPARVREVAPVR
jgi:hypothetical protein